MTTYTREEFAIRVLKDLGVTAAEETPSAADIAFAMQTIEAVVGQLSLEGIDIWGGTDDAMPAEYLVALSHRVGLDIGPPYGLFSIADAMQAKPNANATLRRISARPPTGAVAEAEYF